MTRFAVCHFVTLSRATNTEFTSLLYVWRPQKVLGQVSLRTRTWSHHDEDLDNGHSHWDLHSELLDATTSLPHPMHTVLTLELHKAQ